MISNRINFKCLNNQDVIDHELSDHEPMLVDTPHGKVCYFNIMCQCAKTQYGHNNGFSKVESDKEYKARLQNIISVLRELQQHHGVVGFMLQEAPPPDADHGFYRDLGRALPGFNVDGNLFSRKTPGKRACTFSTFDTTVFPQQIPGDFRNAAVDQVFQLSDSDGNIATVMNIHGDYTNQAATAKLICEAIKRGEIAGGDLNIVEGTQPHIDITNACRASPGINVRIESTRLFKNPTIDVAICNHSPQKKAAYTSVPASHLPVVKSIEQRTNSDKFNFNFNSIEDAKRFSNLLADKGLTGRNGQAFTLQKVNDIEIPTIVVTQDNYSTAMRCCQQAHAANTNLFRKPTVEIALPTLKSVKYAQGRNKNLTQYEFMSKAEATQFSQLLSKKGVGDRQGHPLKLQDDGTIFVSSDYDKIAEECFKKPSPVHSYTSK